ncbi:MAG TPA: hypothetical protein VHC96_05870, partial [Puia sp.]|nr:hypothetical protein [Puia sp.]
IPAGEAPDSEDHLQTFLGKSDTGRHVVVEQGLADPTAIVEGSWKYIRPHPGAALMTAVGIETGNASYPQLYNLKDDIGEKNNLAARYPEKVKELEQLLERIIRR